MACEDDPDAEFAKEILEFSVDDDFEEDIVDLDGDDVPEATLVLPSDGGTRGEAGTTKGGGAPGVAVATATATAMEQPSKVDRVSSGSSDGSDKATRRASLLDDLEVGRCAFRTACGVRAVDAPRKAPSSSQHNRERHSHERRSRSRRDPVLARVRPIA